jgi:rhodanese-related sulfurtransferase
MSVSVDDLVERARRRIRRVGPHELEGLVAEGGLVVDIRPVEQRRREGELPGALVVERNVLEWRLDPCSEFRLAEVRDLHQPVVVVCSAGYASSLAAASLVDLGFEWAADLVGGYQAWSEWFARRGSRVSSQRIAPEPPHGASADGQRGIAQGAPA